MLIANKSFNAVFILLIVSILFNFVIFPNLIIVQLFSLIYLIIIYKLFAKDVKSLLYYSTIIFAIIDFSLLMPIGRKYGVYYFYLTLFLYYCTIIVPLIKSIKLSYFKNRYVLFGFIFLIYVFISLLFAKDKVVSIKSIINYTIMMLLSAMFVFENKNKVTVKNTFLLLKYIFIGVLILGTIEILGFRYGVRNHYYDLGLFVKDYPFLKRVPVVFFYNPNDYGVVLVLAMIVLLINYYVSTSKKDKLLSLALFIVAQINLIFTTSRTGWVTLVFVMIIILINYAILHERSKIKSVFKSLIIVLIVFTVFSLLPGMAVYYGKFNSTPFLRKLNITYANMNKATKPMPISEGGQNSTSERFTLMLDVTNGVFKQGHILGFGAGNIENFIKAQYNTHGVVDVHSLFLEILGDFGIFILIYFLYIYARLMMDSMTIYIKGHEIKNYYFIMEYSLFAFIFLSFGPSSVIAFTPFWILMGLSTALVVNKKELQEF
jgi:teichuronic acid biosynthesis protein TuaE